MDELDVKYQALVDLLAGQGGALVAFSGGVDSTLLAKAARDALGERAAAVTVVSAFVADGERAEAERLAGDIGIRHYALPLDVLGVPRVAANPPDRCYHCKRAILSGILALAAELTIPYICEGSNVDDESDYRAGARAIAEEPRVHSPLREVGLRKAEIRALSRRLGLRTADKPSAACLASRIPYGDTLTEEALRAVALAEEALAERGFTGARVRKHGDLARIELPPAQFAALMEDDARREIAERFKKFGFRYTALDLLGYRMGSLNEAIL